MYQVRSPPRRSLEIAREPPTCLLRGAIPGRKIQGAPLLWGLPEPDTVPSIIQSEHRGRLPDSRRLGPVDPDLSGTAHGRDAT